MKCVVGKITKNTGTGAIYILKTIQVFIRVTFVLLIFIISKIIRLKLVTRKTLQQQIFAIFYMER